MLLRRLPLSLLQYLWIFLAIFIVVGLVGVFTYASTWNRVTESGMISHFSAPIGIAVGFRKDFYSATLNRGGRVLQANEELNHPKGQTDSDVTNKIHSHVEIEITQSFRTKLVDGMELSLMCIAAFDGQFNVTYSIIDMHWTGKKSLWTNHTAIIKQEDRYQRELHFRPWLELNSGEYTCHVVIRTADNHIHVINKTIEVKNEYRGLTASRMFTQKLDSPPITHSKWFPNANLCGNDDVWQKYADFHASVISGKQKRKYLIYDCTREISGGYGNRMQSITSLLLIAMLTNHVFLLDVPNPVNIREYLLPNAIQWNYTTPKGMSSRLINLFATHKFEQLETALLHPWHHDVIRVQTFYGLFYFLQPMSEQFVGRLVSTFNLKTHYDLVLLYGCVFDYLFKYQPRVDHAIKSLQNEYNLETGRFVALHVRSHFHEKHRIFNPFQSDFPFKTMFECAAMAAKALSYKLNVSKVPIFLTADKAEVVDFAKRHYKNMITYSKAPYFHIDETKYNGSTAKDQYDDGIIGILSDIEISSRAAILVRSADSSFSEVMGILHYLPPQNNLHPFYFYENLTLCHVY